MGPDRHPATPPPAVLRRNRRQHPVLTPGCAEPLTVRADLERDGRTVLVRCPFCRRRHVHGIGADGTVYGLRQSHCQDREPRSYVLVPGHGGTP